MRLASAIPSMITDKPGAVRTNAAAARAASVAPETAMPTSACLSAGASFTPSPVMPTMCPFCCNIFTIAYLCSGKNFSEPIGFIDLLRCIQRDLPFRHVAGEEFRRRLNVPAHVQFQCNLPRDRDVIAGNHFDFHAVSARPRDGAFRVGTRRIEKRKNSEESPVVAAARNSHANRT